jgi:dihydrofolate reductase
MALKAGCPVSAIKGTQKSLVSLLPDFIRPPHAGFRKGNLCIEISREICRQMPICHQFLTGSAFRKVADICVMGKIILFIATSIDGKIADENHGVDFLNDFMQPGEDYGTAAFLAGIESIVLGRKTFDAHLGFNHWDAGKKGYVLSSGPVKIPDGWPVEHYTADLGQLLTRLKQEPRDVWLEGGATLVKQALAAGQLDEMIITVVPKTIGRGIALFEGNETGDSWHLVACKPFADGVVQMHYACNASK